MKEIWEKNKTLERFIRPGLVRPGTAYKWSQYALPVRLEDGLFLFNLFTKQCVEYEGTFRADEVFTFAKIDADSSLRELASDSFLVPETRDERAFYEGVLKLVRAVSMKSDYDSYTILPTTACNARCVYCYEEGMKQVSMTDETLAKTIEFILSTHRKDADIRLAWFGGEPLLGTRAIDAICSALSERGVKFRSTMTTNGSLLTEDLVEKMKESWRLNAIQISMDADESDYYAKKRYLLDGDHYRTVLRGIDALAKRNIETTVRCNVDEDSVDGMDQFIRDISVAVSNKSAVSVYPTPIFEVQAGERSGEVWKKCLEVQDRIEREGFSFGKATKLTAFKSIYCMAETPYQSVVIAPDGLLYNCEHCVPGTEIGNLDEGVVKKEYLDSFVFPESAREKCRNCAFLPECTPFSRCPVALNDCREVKEALIMRDLKRAIETRNRVGDADEEKIRNC